MRLISKDGEQLGVVPLQEAKRISNEQNLDLILISKDAKPPVCKLIDYGQYLYQQKKKVKQSKKSAQTIKELKMSHKISIHDYNVRYNQAVKFLSKRYKVKLTLVFRGREIVYRDTLGVNLIEKFLKDVESYGSKDDVIVKSGRNLSVMINPK